MLCFAFHLTSLATISFFRHFKYSLPTKCNKYRGKNRLASSYLGERDEEWERMKERLRWHHHHIIYTHNALRETIIRRVKNMERKEKSHQNHSDSASCLTHLENMTRCCSNTRDYSSQTKIGCSLLPNLTHAPSSSTNHEYFVYASTVCAWRDQKIHKKIYYMNNMLNFI